MKAEQTEFPKTLQEAITYFADPMRGLDFMVSLRWQNGKVTCPHCQSERVSFLATRKKWKCMSCHKQFSAKVGTIFEDSALGYDKWFPAFWLIVNAKNGISSYEIGRALGVTQKTAWFMLQRIRLAMQNGTIVKMGGSVEADETFIGAKARNMHKGKRKVKGTGPVAMTPVMGLLERTTPLRKSRVKLNVLKNRRRAAIQGNVREYVLKGAELYTDALPSYNGLKEEYTHQVIDHAECYAKGKVHTNGLENFWSLLKRTIKGTYVNVEPFHLFRYLDEQAFRFNEREDTDSGRFMKAVSGIIGKSLSYVELIGKGGDDLQPA
ncbi:MAG: IS1595 family transposase [Methylacidiphilales bacterium]|nr:IS1595 family transposase [Candidatus Methylacidiphilales bacterium]